MNRSPLAEDVIRFIEKRIDTVPELETLILLRTSAPKAWTIAEIAARIYVDAAQARTLVLNLERKKLVVTSSADGYVFRDDCPEAESFDRVVLAYRTNVVAIAELIHSKSSPAVREFARAFRIKE